MPSNWLYIDTNFPSFTQKESTGEKIETMQDYLFMLVEQLRYTLRNLDLKNMNKAAADGFVKKITQPIYAEIKDAQGSITQLGITADGLSARISDAEGNITALGATADGLSARISSNEGNITTLTASVSGIQTAVSGKINGKEAMTLITQEIGKITLSASSDSSGTTFQLKSDSMVLSTSTFDLHVKSVNIDGTLTAGALRGGNIDLIAQYYNYMTGALTDISVGSIGLTFTDDNGIGMALSTKHGGIQIISAGNIFLQSKSGTRLLLDGDAAKIGPTVWATDGTVIYSSDKNVKNSIEYDLSGYRDFLLSLKPCRFKYNKGQSGRYHIGMIAQDIEQSLQDNGLSPMDFSGWCRMADPEQESGYTYGIRYDAIIPLNTMMIQELVRRVEALEKQAWR